MKITIKDLYSISEAIAYLSSCQSSAWYAVVKNKRIISPLLKDAEEDRKSIIEKFALKDDKGFVMKVKEGKEVFSFENDEKEKECLMYLEKFYNEEIDVEFYTTPVKNIISESHPEIVIETLLDKIFIE